MNRSGLASVCLLGSLAVSTAASAQDTPTPPPLAPDAAPAADAPAGTEAGASAEGNIELGGDAEADANADAGAEAEPGAAAPLAGEEDPNAERNRRQASLHEENGIDGFTGLLRVVQASSGAAGTFRMSLAGSYFGTSGFLCNSSTPCPRSVDQAANDDDEDGIDRFGMRLGISATLFPFLEATFNMRSMATSDTRSRPRLLQVLGDSSLGVKGFAPIEPDQIWGVGGLAQLLLMNGAGTLGPAGGGTSFQLQALGSLLLDNRTDPDQVIPLRLHANVGWIFNNSAAVV